MSSATSVQERLSTAPWKVLVVGGSYAGLAAATNLLDQCEARVARFLLGSAEESDPGPKIPVEITIIDERDGYYHLIGSPLALADQQYASKAWVKFDELAGLKHPAVKLVHGNVSSIDPDSMTATVCRNGLESSYQEPYDFLIAASGLRRVWPTVPQSLNRSEYIVETQDHITAVTGAKEGVVVIGGGAVGIEMAAELKTVHPSQMVTLIHSRDHLLSSEPLPEDMKDKTASLLREGGVNVILGQRVTNISSAGATSTLTLSNGAQLTTAHVISAISKQVPSTTYLPPEALDPDGYVKISPSLNFPSDTPNYRHHFAIGDIAAWTGIKRCGAAMHMGLFASENIYQQMMHHQSEHTVSAPSSPPLSTSDSSDSVSATSSSSASSNAASEIKPARTLSQHPPMIGLALGRTAISYSPAEGMKWGPDVMERMFGDDLGWSICWNYMRLGELPPSGNEAQKKTERQSEMEKKEEVEKNRRLSQEVQDAKAVVDVEGLETQGKELRRELEIEVQKLRVREEELRRSGEEEEAIVEVF